MAGSDKQKKTRYPEMKKDLYYAQGAKKITATENNLAKGYQGNKDFVQPALERGINTLFPPDHPIDRAVAKGVSTALAPAASTVGNLGYQLGQSILGWEADYRKKVREKDPITSAGYGATAAASLYDTLPLFGRNAMDWLEQSAGAWGSKPKVVENWERSKGYIPSRGSGG